MRIVRLGIKKEGFFFDLNGVRGREHTNRLPFFLFNKYLKIFLKNLNFIAVCFIIILKINDNRRISHLGKFKNEKYQMPVLRQKGSEK